MLKFPTYKKQRGYINGVKHCLLLHSKGGTYESQGSIIKMQKIVCKKVVQGRAVPVHIQQAGGAAAVVQCHEPHILYQSE